MLGTWRRGWAVAGLAGLWVLGAQAQSSFFVILTNGSATNRINLCVLAEGYTASQAQDFRSDATNTVNALLNREPYQSYRRHFNAFGLFVPSVEAGSDHPSQSQYRNTYFNSTYDSYGTAEFVTIPPNDSNPNSADGQDKVAALLNQYLPDCQLALVLVNDLLAGGSGGRTLVVSKPSAARDIIAHESGHTLAGLGDEYDNPYPGYPEVEEPNTTRATRRDQVKWRAWIEETTPLPTPATLDYAAVVGVFEGAHYHSNGWYRPKLNCMMRTVGQPFCEVCSEALIKSFYQRVRPVETFAPGATNLLLTTLARTAFSLQVVRPTNPTLSIRWLTNNVLAPGTGTNFAFTPPIGGVYEIRAEVQDTTAGVRYDPEGLLRQTVVWKLVVPVIALNGPRWTFQRRFCFDLLGGAPSGYEMEASADLIHWTNLGAGWLINGHGTFVDAQGGLPHRFYRARVPLTP